MLALRDAFAARQRNADGDYSPDPKAARFRGFEAARSQSQPMSAPPPKTSLTKLVEDWWTEQKAVGRKPSTHESYRNTVANLVAFLKHDAAGRVTSEDVVRFKSYRLAAINPRTGKAISPKTVKDSDLAGLKTIFGWAVANRRMTANPATGLTIQLGKPQKLRSKGFTDEEARAILKAALGGVDSCDSRGRSNVIQGCLLEATLSVLDRLVLNEASWERMAPL
ncbi:hypothetical protein G3T14_15425, partial [Methylobacterium sp. BTF04]|nr:hypothetical protein [Methylobacterium sp. BTF04]